MKEYIVIKNRVNRAEVLKREANIDNYQNKKLFDQWFYDLER